MKRISFCFKGSDKVYEIITEDKSIIKDFSNPSNINILILERVGSGNILLIDKSNVCMIAIDECVVQPIEDNKFRFQIYGEEERIFFCSDLYKAKDNNNE